VRIGVEAKERRRRTGRANSSLKRRRDRRRGVRRLVILFWADPLWGIGLRRGDTPGLPRAPPRYSLSEAKRALFIPESPPVLRGPGQAEALADAEGPGPGEALTDDSPAAPRTDTPSVRNRHTLGPEPTRFEDQLQISRTSHCIRMRQ